MKIKLNFFYGCVSFNELFFKIMNSQETWKKIQKNFRNIFCLSTSIKESTKRIYFSIFIIIIFLKTKGFVFGNLLKQEAQIANVYSTWMHSFAEGHTVRDEYRMFQKIFYLKWNPISSINSIKLSWKYVSYQ